MSYLMPIEKRLVNFNGAEIMVAKHEDGNIYAGVKWICDGLGLSKGQMQSERQRIQEDIVLSKGERKIILPTTGGNQEVLCIELNFLPLWLAKINANIIDNPEVQERLVDYQLNAKDVLAESFLAKDLRPQPKDSYMIADPIERAKAWIIEAEQTKTLALQLEAQHPKVIFADSVATSKTSILIGELAKIIKGNGVDIGEKRFFAWLRDNKFLISRKGTDYNAPTQKSMDLNLFRVKETVITHSDGHISINKTTKVTGSGQIYFINKFKTALVLT